MKRLGWILFAVILAIPPAGHGEEGGEKPGDGAGQGKGDLARKPSVAFVTNGIHIFWDIAAKGARDAAADAKINANLEVIMPPMGIDDQQRMVRDALGRGVDGIAISPIDPSNQRELLDEIAERRNLITHDSDAPDSKRLCHIGMDNYDAGRTCGKLIKEALPKGGKVMLFVGRLAQDTAKLRRQGVIDELLDRPHDPKRFDDPDKGELKGEKFVILGTRTDNFDFRKAKAIAEVAIIDHPDLGCMVGLFAYNPPVLLDAVTGADKLKKIAIVGFDEDNRTLQGVKDGTIHGTVVQNPYRYGYESVRVLAALARGDTSVLPKGGILKIPERTVTSANVEEYWAELKKHLGK